MGGSLTERRRFVEQAIDAGLIEPAPVPSRETIRALKQKWEAGMHAIEDYVDMPRSGRPRTVLAHPIEQRISDEIFGGRVVNVSRLTRDVQQLAREAGLREPTYKLVLSRVARAGRLARSAARHGSRAGDIDGLPHARVATRFTHDAWALDELTLPLWVGMWCDRERQFVSVTCDVILIVDLASGAVVSWAVADPGARRDEDGRKMRSGYDSADVLAALLGAASPELAPDSTRDFAGYLPDRLRWDNATAHKMLEAQLDAAHVPIDSRRIRKRRAASNGAVERRVGILKQYCAGILGHMDDYIPTDRVDVTTPTESAARTRLAGYTSDRHSRRTPIAPGNLLRIDEVKEKLDTIVRRYNYEMPNRIHGKCPVDRFHEASQPRRPRRGGDLISALEVHSTVVTRDGIVHTANGRTQQYFPLLGGIALMLDHQVTYRADPHGRGIFMDIHGKREFLRAASEWSDEQAATIARNQTFIARLISDSASDIRARDAALAVGQLAVARAEDEYRAQLEAPHEPEQATGSARASAEPAPPQAPRTRTGGTSPWDDDDPDAFIREKDEE